MRRSHTVGESVPQQTTWTCHTGVTASARCESVLGQCHVCFYIVRREVLGRQARTWRGRHQTSGKGRCGDEGREDGPQTSHLPPLLPRGLQGMGTLLVSSQKLHPTPLPFYQRSTSTGLVFALLGLGALFSHLFPPPLSGCLWLLVPNLCLFLPVFLLCCFNAPSPWQTLPTSKNIFTSLN